MFKFGGRIGEERSFDRGRDDDKYKRRRHPNQPFPRSPFREPGPHNPRDTRPVRPRAKRS